MNASAKNLALVVLGLAVLGLATLTWQQNQRIAALEQDAARALEETRAATRRLTAANERVAAAEKRRAELESEPTENRNQPAPVPRERAASGAVRTMLAGNPLDNAGIQRVMATSMKAGLDQRFGGLFRQLKLSPGELDKLKNLLVERQISTMDAVGAAHAQGVTPEGIPALMSKVQADVDQNIRSLLGDERYGRYQDYNQNVGSYSLLDQIERRLSFTNAPLDPAQSAALLRVLAETTAAPSSETGPLRGAGVMFQGIGGGILGGLTAPAITDDTVSRAGSVLSPAQTEVLRQLQAEQQAQASSIQSMRINAVGGAGVAPGAGGTVQIRSSVVMPPDFTIGEAPAVPPPPAAPTP